MEKGILMIEDKKFAKAISELILSHTSMLLWSLTKHTRDGGVVKSLVQIAVPGTASVVSFLSIG